MRRHSPQHRKDRIRRTVAAFVFVCAVVVLGGILIQVDSVSPGRIDTHAAHQIRALCGTNPICTVRLRDLIPGNWDTFYEFSPSVSRPELDQIIRDPRIRTAPFQRVLVLAKDGRTLRRQYAHTGQGEPLAGELVFAALSSGPHHGWVTYAPDTDLQVTRCPTAEGGAAIGHHGGTYYLLTPHPPANPSLPGACPAFAAQDT